MGDSSLHTDSQEADLHAESEDKLRNANEQLYKHSFELATRNKTLSLLRKLYQISLLELQTLPLAKSITTVIRESLEFEGVGIYIYEEGTDTLLPLELSRSGRLEGLAKEASWPFMSSPVHAATKHSFFGSVMKGEARHTSEVQSVWKDVLSTDFLSSIAVAGHLESCAAYPLFLDSRVIGVFVVLLNRPHESLSQFEMESLESVVNVTAIALDRARLYEEVNLANEQQVVLIHFITHQIKGFIAKSRNIFSLMLDGDYGVLPAPALEAAKIGFESDTKGAQTIKEILNAANIKNGKVVYQKEVFDLTSMLREILKDLEAQAQKKGLALTVELADVSYTGDETQLVNAFRNLIDNSIKYTPSGTVSVSLKNDGGKVHFEINDTGVGIESSDMKNLFTEGGHGKNSQKINVESTGFGLYIVKNIIEAHGGRVWAESEGEGKGARFIVELPA